MAKLEKATKEVLAEAGAMEFPAAVSRINSYMYETLEAQRNKGGKVTENIMGIMKKCMDSIAIWLVKAHRDCVSSETKLKTLITHNKAYEALADRFSKSTGHMDASHQVPVMTSTQQRDSDYSVIVTSSGEETLDNIKKDIKEICRSQVEVPIPGDVVVTKAGQLILKVRSKVDSEKLRGVLVDSAGLKDRIRVSVPKRRLERVLITSVDPEVGEDLVLKSLNKVLNEAGKGVFGDIDIDKDVEIIRCIVTRAGKANWMIGVGKEVAQFLIKKRRICIDLERYRVVGFVPIIRCFNCQTFGHIASKCEKETKCVKCAGEHLLRDCNVDSEMCVNCMSVTDLDIDADHRADSPDCPQFKAYRADQLAKRL